MTRKSVLSSLVAISIIVAISHGAEPGRTEKLYVLLPGVEDMAVVDVATSKIIKMVRVGRGAHGLAAAHNDTIVWVGVENTGWLVKVDAIRDEVIGRYPIGRRPNEIEVTPDGRFVYVPVLAEGEWRVFDTVENRIVAEIPTLGFPHNTVVSADGQRMYLAPYDLQMRSLADMIAQGLPTTMNNKIYVADTRTHKVVRTIDTTGAPRPLALSKDERRLYVNTDGLLGFVVVDVPAGKVIHRVEYPLTAEEKATPSRSHGISLTVDQREVWSNDVNHNATFVYDVSIEPPRFVTRLPMAGPYWNTQTPDGKTLYIANTQDETVRVIDVAARKERGRIQFPQGTGPHRIQVLSVPTS